MVIKAQGPAISQHLAAALRRPLEIVQVDVHREALAGGSGGHEEVRCVLYVDLEPAQVPAQGEDALG